MARKFSELRAAIGEPRRRRAHERAQEMLAAMPLQELRRARELTQQALAKALGSNQASVSRLEQRTDMYVSSLRGYIEALGGQLEIVARFPEGVVRIKQFEEIA